MVVNNGLKGCGKKFSWPNLRYHPGICVAVMRKTTRISVRIVSVLVKFLAGQLLNTSQKDYCLSQFVGFVILLNFISINIKPVHDIYISKYVFIYRFKMKIFFTNIPCALKCFFFPFGDREM